MIIALAILFALALGGVAFAFTGGDEKAQKRVAAVAKPAGQARGSRATPAQEAAQKRKNVAAMLKDVEKNRAAKKEKPTMRRRLEQAGFPKATPRSFWMICGIMAALAASARHHDPSEAAGGSCLPCSWWGWACRAGCWAFSPRGARRSSPRISPTPST